MRSHGDTEGCAGSFPEGARRAGLGLSITYPKANVANCFPTLYTPSDQCPLQKREDVNGICGAEGQTRSSSHLWQVHLHLQMAFGVHIETWQHLFPFVFFC